MTEQPVTKPTMAERIAADLEADPLAHEWIIAAEVAVDHKTARRTSFRGSYRTEAGQRVDALDTYCRRCKRVFDEVADQDCAAKVDNTHLIGGNPGERAPRKHYETIGAIEYVPVLPRREMRYGGFSVHSRKM